MIDFMIRKGLSSALFSEPGVVNPKLVIEEGCWYLCTDTAELFLGIRTDSGLDLKRINDENIDSVKQEVINAVKPDVDDIKTTVQTVILPKVETVEELRAWIENKEYLQDIDLEGFATEEFVNDAIANCEKESEIYKVDFNAPDYASAVDAYKAGKVLVLVNAAPDVNSYAVMNYVSEKYITFTKFLMSRSETYGAFNTYYLRNDNTWEISKEVKLNKVEITADGDLQIGKELYKTPSIEGLATEEFVAKKIAEAELADKEADLEAYYTKSEIDALIPEVPAKVSELENDAGYITAEDIPETDLSNYYNKAEVDNIINGIEIPSIEGLVTEESFERELDKKADKVPFTTAKFVTRAVGGFTIGDSVKGLTIAEIFAKLLGLSDENPNENPDIPDMPDEPTSIVETIITEQIPMYEIDETCNAIEMPYAYTIFEKDSSSDLEEPTQTGFYQKTENGNIIESGYQHVSSENDSMYYIIALPKGVDFNTNVTVLAYDPMDASDPWKPADLVMTSDSAFIAQAFAEADLAVPETNTETHKLWIDESLNVYDGSIYRFIINE